MHFSRKGAVVVGLLGALLAPGTLWAQSLPPHAPTHWLPDQDWSGQSLCRYPGPIQKSANTSKSAASIGRITVINEQETQAGENDVFANAETLTLAPEPMSPLNIDVKGTIQIGEDVDLYRFTAAKGDVLGVAVLGEASLNPVLSIQDLGGMTLIENDDHGGFAFYYPPGSPFPGGVGLLDSALTWICPSNGDYLINVRSYVSASRGSYTLQIRSRRPSMEDQNLGSTQIIYLDFDGATINAYETFRIYGAKPVATLSPMRDFLPYWGLTAADEAAAIEAIVSSVEHTFDSLRVASLNGNRDTDNTSGHFDVQVLNSRDHADPWGQPNVSRVIIGGTMEQLGISTIGISQSIDPGNFVREETAVVLLDLLSDTNLTYTDPQTGQTILAIWTINNMSAASGLTKFDLIGRTVGNIVVHEVGHYLGNWHTDCTNQFNTIMDEGGTDTVSVPVWITAGAGPDRTLGTSDDEVIDFAPDEYSTFEQIAVGEEQTDVNSAFAMATGRVQRETTPDTPEWPYPLPAVRATPASGSPPLSVQFWAGGIDNDLKDLTFTWDFTDGTPVATGSVVTHVFENPGQFLVKVTASNSQGVKGQTTILITVATSLPTASIEANPVRGAAPLTVNFDGSSSTAAAGNIVTYAWDFGDGSTGSGATVPHTYNAQGYYAAKLTITDSFGGTSTASVLITVNAPLEVSDSAQSVPSTNPSGAAPQCGLGSGVLMAGSLMGLFVISKRRRF